MSELKRYFLGDLWGSLEAYKGMQVYDANLADAYIAEHLPRWIPVSPDTLPDKKCIATYLNSHDKRRTIIAVYVPRFTIESSGEADDYDEYLVNTDTYYFKEGWYECQENWGEYAMIYVNDGDITHWQHLPPPPTQEEGQ